MKATYDALGRDSLLDIAKSFHSIAKVFRILGKNHENELGIDLAALFSQNLALAHEHTRTHTINQPRPRTLDTFPCAIRGVDIELGFDTSSRAGKSVGQSVSQSKPNHPLIPWLLIS